MNDRTSVGHESNGALAPRNPARAAASDRRPDELEEIASRWVVLNTGGEPSEHDRQAFSAWYAGDVRHAQMYDELLDIWNRLSAVDAGAIPAKRRRRNAMTSLLILAFVFVGSASLYRDSLRIAALADASTGIGEVRTVSLADGSSVLLDAQSAIAVDLTPAARNVHLLRGRALFEVAHDPSRPFVVRTDNAEATALGTRFTVETLDGHSHVAVLQSRVAVRCTACDEPGVSRVLSPNDESDVSLLGVSSPRITDAAAIASWSQGTLTFENVSLRDALAELQRYSHRRIWLADRSAGERRVSALVDPRRPDAALRVIAAAAKLDVHAVPGMLLVGSPKNIFAQR
ncbi:MAG TPA: FecR domain-containing protein [Paraburkholderia sp.]|uniref:FecR family protein n=1 Tax=Paraburkholderia sp. TaxID=1926495 RepID=UPI002ED3801A